VPETGCSSHRSAADSLPILEKGIVLWLENSKFKVRKGVSANFEFEFVAISLFFASLR
jgi:hypothetical protein